MNEYARTQLCKAIGYLAEGNATAAEDACRRAYQTLVDLARDEKLKRIIAARRKLDRLAAANPTES
jgi:hypothetical protein